MLLTTTLSMAAAAAVINFWLALRCGQVRAKEKISIGTGGSDLLERRMRAQLNFAENTPWVLALIAGIELAGKGGAWLAPLGALFLLGRVAHGIGMDGHEPVNLVHLEQTPLDVGMCFSNEPGIYLPGKFGVRLEDCFTMTANGPRLFTELAPSIERVFG